MKRWAIALIIAAVLLGFVIMSVSAKETNAEKYKNIYPPLDCKEKCKVARYDCTDLCANNVADNNECIVKCAVIYKKCKDGCPNK